MIYMLSLDTLHYSEDFLVPDSQRADDLTMMVEAIHTHTHTNF